MSERIVVGHRGASGYLPEHTLPAYAMAHSLGADFIEPDLVRTRDGAFICLHDIYLEATTDVREVFPEARREDGRWYAADLSLEEIRCLRVHERLEGRFPRGSAARFEVPTFEEMIELVQGLNLTTGRDVGIYPELKAPAWHRQNDLPMEQGFLEIVQAHGYDGGDARIFVQCFESEPLERLRRLGSRLPQVRLLGGGDEVNEALLDEISGFANAIGLAKSLLEANPRLAEWAHQRRLAVHAYTFRADDLPGHFSTFDDELALFFGEYGVDGVFTDFPDLARRWLSRWCQDSCRPAEEPVA